MIVQMPTQKFRKILPKICGKDTSFDPKGWTKDNLFWGHSSVVSLLAQSLFQGVIYGVVLKGTKFAKLKFHFWNFFPDGTQEDFTRSQFGKEYPGELEIKEAEVSVMMADKSTLRRFNLLQERFEAECKKS
ncbi:MAG: hypothetical protein G01um101444_348 [Parcubacteria group bacterium Gr01-1014_44]|nr:MAG: hypothetical protein G01um101444_348 [Parcubacteria group bacterium Gr01-1014_44]